MADGYVAQFIAVGVRHGRCPAHGAGDAAGEQAKRRNA